MYGGYRIYVQNQENTIQKQEGPKAVSVCGQQSNEISTASLKTHLPLTMVVIVTGTFQGRIQQTK